MPTHPFILETVCQPFPGSKETDRYGAPSLEFPSCAIEQVPRGEGQRSAQGYDSGSVGRIHAEHTLDPGSKLQQYKT